jgi:hypothetical protein
MATANLKERQRKLLRDPGFGQRVKRMDRALYRECRRPVIDIIRMAKRWLQNEGLDLPRIEVRITEQDRHLINGSAYLNRCVIFITEDAIKRNDSDRLVRTVLHEVVHAVTGFEHDDDCPLMSPVSSAYDCLSPDELKPTFIKYIRGY